MKAGLLAGRQSGGGGDVPTTDLTAWYDFSDESTITDSGGVVSGVTDKSASGFDLTVPSGETGPDTGVNTRNSLNVLTFANHEGLEYNEASLGGLVDNHMTMYVVFKATGGLTFDSAPCVLTAGNQGKPMDRYNTVWYILNSLVSSSYNDMGAETSWCYFTWTAEQDGVSAGTHEFIEYKNGTSTNTGSDASVWNNSAFNIGVGQRQDSATQFIGDIGEILIYDAIHDTGTRGDIEAYLADKWNL